MKNKKPDKRSETIRMIQSTWKSADVVGRGTVFIDPREVEQSQQMKDARKRAKSLVENNRGGE